MVVVATQLPLELVKNGFQQKCEFFKVFKLIFSLVMHKLQLLSKGFNCLRAFTDKNGWNVQVGEIHPPMTISRISNKLKSGGQKL